jgi:hypothetical protein
MKQLAILFIIGIILGILFVWMDESDREYDPSNIPEEKISPKSDIRYCIIDSCEYITWGHGLAHKGNCRFCAERYRNGLKELVELNNNDNYDKDSI